jgi:hypothetical protein
MVFCVRSHKARSGSGGGRGRGGGWARGLFLFSILNMYISHVNCLTSKMTEEGETSETPCFLVLFFGKRKKSSAV